MHICLQLASLRTNFPLITVIKSTFIHDVHAREFSLFAFQTPNAHSKPDAIDAMFSPIYTTFTQKFEHCFACEGAFQSPEAPKGLRHTSTRIGAWFASQCKTIC